MMMSRPLFLLGLALALTFPISSYSNPEFQKTDPCTDFSRWSEFSQFSVTYSNPTTKESNRFDYWQQDKDLFITIDTLKGKVNMFSIDGVGSLWRGIGQTGIKSAQACGQDVGDTHTIFLGRAVKALVLLDSGVKDGPETISDDVNIDVSDQNDREIYINPSDTVIIRGPWSLTGRVSKNEKISFEMTLKSTIKNKPKRMYLDGSWQKTPVKFPVQDREPLGEWLVCLTGPIPEMKDAPTTIGDLKALRPQAASVNTPVEYPE